MKTGNNICTTLAMHPAEPLWKRAPHADAEGRPLADFMMILPALRHKPQHFIDQTIRRIEQVLARYADVVVFADFNLRLNVLMVITHQVPGIGWELPCAITDRVPEALLVAQPRFF